MKAQPALLIRYGEIGVKLGRARRVFEEALIRSIRCFLGPEGICGRLVWRPGRIVLLLREYSEAVKAARLASRVFGVVASAPAWITGNDIDELGDAVVELFRDVLSSAGSFAIRARRVKSYPLTSRDVARILGEKVVRTFGLRVDLEKPDVEIHVDVREDFAVLYTGEYRGPGGLPYGVEGDAYVAVVRGTCEELAAAWAIARRGARLNLVVPRAATSIVEKVWSFVENHIPCGDASVIKVDEPLSFVARLGARLRGLPVYADVLNVDGVWLLSPLREAPGVVVERALRYVCSSSSSTS